MRIFTTVPCSINHIISTFLIEILGAIKCKRAVDRMFLVGLQEELTLSLSGLLLLRLFNVSQMAGTGNAAKLVDFETLRNDAMFLSKERSASNLSNTSVLHSTENKQLVNGYLLSARAKIVEDYELV